MYIPTIATTNDEFVIRIPRRLFSWALPSRRRAKKRSPITFDYMRGALADVPEFKGKTSVEVQHMMSDLWAKKYTS